MLQPYPQADAVLLVRPADMSLEAQLREAFGRPCTVRADESITLGGLRLRSDAARLTVDDTLEMRLEQQKPQFRLGGRAAGTVRGDDHDKRKNRCIRQRTGYYGG